MDNGQMPPIQPAAPAMPYQAASGQPMVQQVQITPTKKHDVGGLVKTIVIIILTLVAVTFIGLFIWMYLQYSEARDDVDGQIADAVAIAKDEQATKDEADFLEREKNPYLNFSGPIDYGELSFKYPKTWSIYIARDAANGGDFEAYFNPVQVDPISNTTINALRVQILNRTFEDVARSYEGALNNKDRVLNLESITVNGTAANLYKGAIPGTELNGLILIFKIRDKTAVLRSDSLLFENDFKNLVETITFNA